jgi:hypothetical protein
MLPPALVAQMAAFFVATQAPSPTPITVPDMIQTINHLSPDRQRHMHVTYIQRLQQHQIQIQQQQGRPTSAPPPMATQQQQQAQGLHPSLLSNSTPASASSTPPTVTRSLPHVPVLAAPSLPPTSSAPPVPSVPVSAPTPEPKAGASPAATATPKGDTPKAATPKTATPSLPAVSAPAADAKKSAASSAPETASSTPAATAAPAPPKKVRNRAKEKEARAAARAREAAAREKRKQEEEEKEKEKERAKEREREKDKDKEKDMGDNAKSLARPTTTAGNDDMAGGRNRAANDGFRNTMRGEIARMMYACGDVPEPDVDSVEVVEDMVVEFLADFCRPVEPMRTAVGLPRQAVPLRAEVLRHRLASHSYLRKYLTRWDDMAYMMVELQQSRNVAAPSHAQLIASVGKDFLGLDEAEGDAAAGVKRRAPANAEDDAANKRRGRPPKEPGERKKPGPKKGWKKNLDPNALLPKRRPAARPSLFKKGTSVGRAAASSATPGSPAVTPAPS